MHLRQADALAGYVFDALDQRSVAILEHEHLVRDGDTPGGVDGEPVALGESGFHRFVARGLTGGAACDVLIGEAGFPFRATTDFDIVRDTEARSRA